MHNVGRRGTHDETEKQSGRVRTRRPWIGWYPSGLMVTLRMSVSIACWQWRPDGRVRSKAWEHAVLFHKDGVSVRNMARGPHKVKDDILIPSSDWH